MQAMSRRSEADPMARALGLAARAEYATAPNPMVGAVVVRDGVVVGEGFHSGPGSAHAEVVALAAAGELARGAELYVTLEPCCTTGRTGPCTERILEAGVRRVHAAILDPNPLVDGRGVERLRQSGVEVILGQRAEEATRLIEFYAVWVTAGRPFVTLKLAASLDGKVATAAGESRWITGEAARRDGHELRRRHDAVMVGVGTVLADDPALTLRHGLEGGRAPVRVVADSKLRTPVSARLLADRTAPTWIAAAGPMPDKQSALLRAAGAELLELPSDHGRVSLPALLAELGRREITSLLVEGGPTLAGRLTTERLVNRMVVFLAPLVLGGQDALSAIGGPGVLALSDAWRLNWTSVERVGADLRLTAEI